MDPKTPSSHAVDSSGRAVIFAGITVMISLLGLFIMGLSFVRGLAVAGAIGVLVMMVAAITLLPALLGFAGERIDVTSRAAAIAVGRLRGAGPRRRVHRHRRSALLCSAPSLVAVVVMGISFLPFGKALREPLPHRHAKPREQQFWYRWSRIIQHRPWPPLLIGVGLLLLLALPLFSHPPRLQRQGQRCQETRRSASRTTPSPRRSGRAPTARCSWPAPTRRSPPRRPQRSTPRLAADKDITFVHAGVPRSARGHVGVAGLPEVSPAGRGHHGPRQPAARRRPAGHRPRRQGRRRSPPAASTSPTTSPAACRC